jgi:MoaA/NifB/PqqE/SkfB family radical SAM enzyme
MDGFQSPNLCNLNPEQLERLIRGRRLFLWGASIVGQGVCRALTRCGCSLTAFIDSSPRFKGRRVSHYPVLLPEEILADPEVRQDAFIILSSGHYEGEMARACLAAGMNEDVDFISARRLSPLDPSVDISGLCNLKCISCPRGNMPDQPPAGFIAAETYEKVLEKLLREIPLMGNVQLYAWGEPLLNGQAAEIIKITNDRQVLCALSTNLNFSRTLDPVMAARPDWLKISASGYGASYERTHTGGKWDRFLRNLHRLAELRAKYHPEMYVELNYHLYRHNLGNDLRKMRDLCSELGFAFRPNWAYLYPLDNVLAYCQGQELSRQAHETQELLLLSLEDGLALARRQAQLPCAEERCLPIDWNLSVRSCGAYFKPRLVDNFLEHSLEDILRLRTESGICRTCKQHALHRFTSVYVEETAHDDRFFLEMTEGTAKRDSVECGASLE